MVVVGLAGCGSGKVRVYPVKGKVLLDGKPMVGGGAITFIPLTAQAGKAAGGEIAADGTYAMTTYKPGDGSMVGEFRVVIHQTGDREPEATPDGVKPKEPIPSLAPADRIPEVYSDAQHSPLKVKVEAKNPNEIDFKLDRNAVGPNTRPPGARADAPARDPVALLRR
jgi:hypothetical protein